MGIYQAVSGASQEWKMYDKEISSFKYLVQTKKFI